jgi:cytochrome c-type biogenesis protein CcsB
MKKIVNLLFSMQTMGILMLIFAVSLGTATFIENDFGATAAKAVVYNHLWFNILLFLLAVNLVANIIRYKMYRLKKLALFLFHISFLIILLGSAITRFISYEGMMHIREGETANTMLSDQAFVSVVMNSEKETIRSSEPVNISVLTPRDYSDKMSIADKDFQFKSVKYIPNAREIIAEVQDGKPYMVIVASDEYSGRQTFYFEYGSSRQLAAQKVSFDNTFDPAAINIRYTNEMLEIFPVDTTFTISMAGDPNDTLLPGKWYPFEMKKLYQTSGLNIVMTNFYPSGGIDYAPYEGTDVTLMDALTIEVRSGDDSKQITLRGGKGYAGEAEYFSFAGLNFKMTYGAKDIQLPFAIKLNEFQLEHYPGSMSPSSYASEVTLIDEKNNIRKDQRIYMNNVLNYEGFRFFQSSYDQDEKGTILSVNHDYWGTFFTYIGYTLMALGMFLALFTGATRFASLGKKLRKNIAQTKSTSLAILLLITFSGSSLFAQHGHLSPKEIPDVDEQLATDFGRLLVQSHDGRLKPINTLSSEVLRKLSYKNKLFGMRADQVFLGMLSQPMYWQQVAMIKIKNPQLRKMLGLEGKYASYMDFIDMSSGTYKLGDYVSTAYAKKPARRNMFDKDVIKADERLNICYMVYTGEFLKILPSPTDPYAAWLSPTAHLQGFSAEDSLFLSTVIPAFFETVKQGNTAQANELLVGIANYQKKYGAAILPDENKTEMEITYNRMMIFNNLGKIYGLLGLIMIILVFANLFRNSKTLNAIIKGIVVLVVVGFVFQTAGLGIRWYISGHAPWSDGYESLIYIAWVTLLAGLAFSKRSNMTIAATTILTSIILMVAHLSWMDPEVTNLVPVLKSYWLTIHVSVITASYGFLALGMLLGFINLLLMIFKTTNNFEKIELRITELTAINERALTIGLYMLTIGTFLGGVWANESWGRYWGWDPKETWALVSVLVYAFILHMRFIPGLKGNYAFNFASLIGYFSILMTYFGVNYYLSGLHSYAAGDPVPIPDFVYYALGVIAILSVWAYVKEGKVSVVKRDN